MSCTDTQLDTIPNTAYLVTGCGEDNVALDALPNTTEVLTADETFTQLDSIDASDTVFVADTDDPVECDEYLPGPADCTGFASQYYVDIGTTACDDCDLNADPVSGNVMQDTDPCDFYDNISTQTIIITYNTGTGTYSLQLQCAKDGGTGQAILWLGYKYGGCTPAGVYTYDSTTCVSGGVQPATITVSAAV